MKIGIFGGSFNPIHNYHIEIAKSAKDSLELDEVWLLPVYEPVHKSNSHLLDFKLRSKLINLAIADFPELKLSEVEKQIGGPSFTIKTVEFLQKNIPENSYTLIIGGDSLKDLPHWRSSEKLLKLLPIAVVKRAGFEDLSLADTKLLNINIPTSSISGTSIRKQLKNQNFSNIQLPRVVFKEIIRKNYYQLYDNTMLNIHNKITQKLTELPLGLQRHILSVADLCIDYSVELGANPIYAYISGLAHDLFRNATPEEILSLVSKSNYQLLPLEQRIPMLAHGAAAASYLKAVDKTTPTELLDAIRWHTLLNSNPSLLLMSLAMADTLEQGRNDPSRDKIYKQKITAFERYQLVCELKNNHRKKKAKKDKLVNFQ